MLKVLQIRIQEKRSYKFRNSETALLNKRTGLTDQDIDLQNLIKVQQLIKPIKLLGFQI